ncbi:hypothetical protein LINPERPRIM_LOCUS11257 [Linum perenne]
MNFPEGLVKVIEACISTTSFQVQWNGGLSDNFLPSRGLRQGCPLSPLFVYSLSRET